MKKLLLLFLMIILSGIGGGCASIVSGTSQELTFQSQPDGATVTVNGKVIGKTPVTTMLKKKSDQAVVFEKVGYNPQTMQLSTRLDPWFWGNIVLGGLIGSTTDGLSGAVHEYTPNQYFVTLQPSEKTQIDQTSQQIRKAKEFIILGYQNIMADLSKGKGEYLSSLMSVLSVPPAEQNEAITKIRALSQVYTDIPTFADKVIELYIK